jgi:hypothetical protein
MYAALTWGHNFPGEDPKESIVSHALIICIFLIVVIGEAIAVHSYDSLTTESTEPDPSLGEEIFGTVLFAGFFSLYEGLKWHMLPAAVYAKHLEGTLSGVLVIAFLIILWADGIFDRRRR